MAAICQFSSASIVLYHRKLNCVSELWHFLGDLLSNSLSLFQIVDDWNRLPYDIVIAGLQPPLSVFTE